MVGVLAVIVGLFVGGFLLWVILAIILRKIAKIIGVID